MVSVWLGIIKKDWNDAWLAIYNVPARAPCLLDGINFSDGQKLGAADSSWVFWLIVQHAPHKFCIFLAIVT